MKKVLAIIVSTFVLTACLSACSDDETSSSSQATESSSTTESETEKETEEETTEETDAPETEGTDLEKLTNAVEAHFNNEIFFEVVEDETMLLENFLIDVKNENFKKVRVISNPMSAVLCEIMVIETADGKVDEAVASFEARKTKLIEQDAFYPNLVEVAEQSIIGKEGNIAYFIAAEDSAGAEQALLEVLKG